MATDRLTPTQLEELRQFDTCTVSNAIETFAVRLRNVGFADSRIRCMFEDLPLPMVGYAVTVRVRTSLPPMHGQHYYDRTDWWSHVLEIPAPQVIVVEDVDQKPGFGSFVGEVHANILLALGCLGIVTNGAVRDLAAVHATGFQMFAGNVSVSHAFAHIIESGGTVEVGGLNIRPGDLLHGDRHGILTIPLDIATRVPQVARDLLERERRIVEFCRSPDFSLEKLRETLKALKQ
jgi:regulator of RNase E activity RraA